MDNAPEMIDPNRVEEEKEFEQRLKLVAAQGRLAKKEVASNCEHRLLSPCAALQSGRG